MLRFLTSERNDMRNHHYVEYTELDSHMTTDSATNEIIGDLEQVKKNGDKFFEENTPWQGFLKIIKGQGPYTCSDQLVHNIPSIYTEMYLEQFESYKDKDE